jgi:hypothetical protein
MPRIALFEASWQDLGVVSRPFRVSAQSYMALNYEDDRNAGCRQAQIEVDLLEGRGAGHCPHDLELSLVPRLSCWRVTPHDLSTFATGIDNESSSAMQNNSSGIQWGHGNVLARPGQFKR